MGQAKQRGTFEERKKQAMERKEMFTKEPWLKNPTEDNNQFVASYAEQYLNSVLPPWQIPKG